MKAADVRIVTDSREDAETAAAILRSTVGDRLALHAARPGRKGGYLAYGTLNLSSSGAAPAERAVIDALRAIGCEALRDGERWIGLAAGRQATATTEVEALLAAAELALLAAAKGDPAC